MAELEYDPEEITVHQEGAIRLLCQAFQSHESGLPEWAKNSADAYFRPEQPPGRRVIVLIFDYGRRGRAASVSCLDFVGMTSHDIEQYFTRWADPEAARRGEIVVDIQGGHGNGGKSYMTQMFQNFAYLHTVRGNQGNRYGVEAGSVIYSDLINTA